MGGIGDGDDDLHRIIDYTDIAVLTTRESVAYDIKLRFANTN